MQFPFGLILIKVGNARQCPNSSAGAEQCWGTAVLGHREAPQPPGHSPLPFAAWCACSRDGMENIRREWFHRNTASVTVSAALAAVMCRTRCTGLCGKQGWGMRDEGEDRRHATEGHVYVLGRRWGMWNPERDGGSSRIKPVSEHPYSCRGLQPQ